MKMVEVCTECGGRYALVKGKRNGLDYDAYTCSSCGDTIFTMEQARSFMTAVEAARQVTFSKWGDNLAVRIPADVVRRLGLKPKGKGRLVEKGKGFTIFPVNG